MSRAGDLRKLIAELLRGAVLQRMHVQCPSHKKALELRSRIYRFRTRLQRNPQSDPFLAIMAPIAQTHVEGRRLTVTYPKEQLIYASDSSSSDSANA